MPLDAEQNDNYPLGETIEQWEVEQFLESMEADCKQVLKEHGYALDELATDESDWGPPDRPAALDLIDQRAQRGVTELADVEDCLLPQAASWGLTLIRKAREAIAAGDVYGAAYFTLQAAMRSRLLTLAVEKPARASILKRRAAQATNAKRWPTGEALAVEDVRLQAAELGRRQPGLSKNAIARLLRRKYAEGGKKRKPATIRRLLQTPRKP
jgi:hypothetical protein